MSYKITKANEATFYEAPGHYEMRPTRLHNPDEVNDGKLIVGLSHFLPGGGATQNAVPLEFVYYVISGEMTITLDDGEFVLKAGDSIHCGPMTTKEIKNNALVTATMLVILLPSEQK